LGKADDNRDFYKILGVSRKATGEEIKKAYRTLSLQYHPDKNPSKDAASKFSDVAAAYECLSNPEKKQTYDRGGEKALKQMEMRENSGAGGDPFSSMFDVFGQFRQRGDQELRTSDLVIPLRVSLRQLYQGDSFGVKYVRQVLCLSHDQCEKNCADCHGPGLRIKKQQIAPGFVQQVQMHDSECVARGKCWKPNCKACPNGQTQKERIEVTVDIVPGMKDGEEIRFSGVADEAIGHIPGDLLMVIKATQHDWFKRSGDNLHISLDVPLVDALVGFGHEITHIDGHKVNFTKNTVTSDGEVSIIKGQGMPRKTKGGVGFGDLHITVNIKYPKVLDEKQRTAIESVLRNAKY